MSSFYLSFNFRTMSKSSAVKAESAKSKPKSSLKSSIRKDDVSNDSKSRGNRLSNLQEQFTKKLEGARFRSINEELYTTSGDSSFSEFQKDQSKFYAYHKGYREQVSSWPYNPLDRIVDWIKRNHPTAVVADMGCGEAKLAESLSTNKVHSFDLVAVNDKVTACNIAAVPIPNESVDIVVFCLSLMGTNFIDFLKEGHRILKINGTIKIIEVRSRFEDGKGIKKFTKYLKRMGFIIQPQENLSDNKMFFEIDCRKVSKECRLPDGLIELKPCQYKKR